MIDISYRPNLAFVFSLIVNISCIIFVSWKSTECFIKYIEYPQGTKVDIKLSGNTAQFPTVTICAANTNKNPPGIRWNISHLNKCGLKGEEYETKWVGHGNDDTCTDPKQLWESVVAKLEDLISYIKVQYYETSKTEKFTFEQFRHNETIIGKTTGYKIHQIHDIVSSLETSHGRCYSMIPTSEMIGLGIRRVEFGFVSMIRVYIHGPGMHKYDSEKGTAFANVKQKRILYKVEHELFEMLNDKSEPCHEDPKYKRDNCVEDELQKFLMKEYGCVPPFFQNKENICTNETITKLVWKDWESMKLYTNCTDRCKEMSVQATWMKNKEKQNSEAVFYFQRRVKVVKSYYAYSGLSLIAEIGGYFGLFLGVSINQITYLTSIVQERMSKYF